MQDASALLGLPDGARATRPFRAPRSRAPFARRGRLESLALKPLLWILLPLVLSACAGLKGRPRDPNRKPFWEREEQRDD